MKKNNFLFLSVLLVLFCLGFIACSDDDDKDDPKSQITHEEIIGTYGVVSCVSIGKNGIPVANSSREGESWFIDESTLTIGNAGTVDYQYSNNKISTASREYRISKDNQSLVVTYVDENNQTVILVLAIIKLPVYNCILSPAIGGQDAYVDTYLDLTFNVAPTLGTSGSIIVYKKDGTKVDEIKMEDGYVSDYTNARDGLYNTTKMDLIGLPTPDNSYRIRAVNYYPVTIAENKVRIKLHYAVLDYDTEYYVTIDKSVILCDGFEGVKAGEWSFKTKSVIPSTTLETITVDDNGDADFRTIQAAIDHAAKIGKDNKVTVYIKNGIYEELLYVRGKNNLTIKGESREGVIIRYDNYDTLNPGVGGAVAKPAFGDKVNSGGRPIFLIESADNLRLENLTMENTHLRIGNANHQAETFYFNSAYTLVIVNCNLISKQDTVNVKGYCWFYNSLIEGDVDFIWGGPMVALFEQCEIRSVTGGAYILQARVPKGNSTDKGFVFLSCKLTKAAGVSDQSTYLARSGYGDYFDNAAYIKCEMDSHIHSLGWWVDNGKSPNPAVASINSGWKEYGSMDLNGKALDLSTRRVDVQYQLTTAEYEAGYKNREQIMSAKPGFPF